MYFLIVKIEVGTEISDYLGQTENKHVVDCSIYVYIFS